METIAILIITVYYLFCCVCMQSYIHNNSENMTLGKAIFYLVLALIISPIYVPILFGIKVGEWFSEI